VESVVGDAVHPPLADGAFGVVAALGNLLGFAEDRSDDLFESLLWLVAPGGTVLLEIAPGPGERSRYLRRLPASSVGRLLRAPSGAIQRRILGEGFLPEPPRKSRPGEFTRIAARELERKLAARGFQVTESIAVAPALGSDAERIAAVARDPKAWAHVVVVAVALGRAPERQIEAASVLVAALAPYEPSASAPRRPPPKRTIK
jgi:hypothetical protein